jgi:hypothetical protein
VLADILRNPVYGGAFPDSRIDLQTLYELDAVWTARKDEFNGVFDKRVTVWSALTTVARAGRARPVMRGNVVTFIRDSEQTLPVALFNMRNIERGSFNVEYLMVTEDTPDGIEIEYFSSLTWASAYVTAALPGVVGDPIQPARASVLGMTNEYQVRREAAYMAADAAYRRTLISFTTEMEGYLPAFGDLIAVAHDITGWGKSGEFESFDGVIATCTEELDWSVGDNYVVIATPQGDVAGPWKVDPGDLPRSMIFPDGMPGLGDIVTDTDMDRTRYAMGPASSYAKLCRVLSLQPSADNKVRIRAVVEDTRVHYADLLYAGFGPGGDTGGGLTPGGRRRAVYMADGTPVYNASSDAQHANGGYYSDDIGKVGTPPVEGYAYDA